MWLKIDDKNIVNLDHVACVEILDMTATKQNRGPFQENPTELFHVALYPANADAEPFTACSGSRSKCEDYMRALGEYVDCKKIIAVGVHQCSCLCGCQNVVRTDFIFCDDCQSDDHWDSKGFVAFQLKKDAA